MTKFIKSMGLIVFFVFILSTLGFSQQSEQVTITTYYPSPYGVYNELQLYGHADAVTQPCNQQNEGTLYYDNSPTEHVLKVCSWTGSQYEYVPVPGGGQAAGYWAAMPSNPNNIYNTNSGNVGIGTVIPVAKLDVNGIVRGTIQVRDQTTVDNSGIQGDTVTAYDDNGALGTCDANKHGILQIIYLSRYKRDCLCWCALDDNGPSAGYNWLCLAPGT